MKSTLLRFGLSLILLASLSSCFTHRYKVGPVNLAEKTFTKEGKNHFLFMGLVKLNMAPLDSLTSDSLNYEVAVLHSFPDVLVSAITIGIYTPTTVRVKISATKPEEKEKKVYKSPLKKYK